MGWLGVPLRVRLPSVAISGDKVVSTTRLVGYSVHFRAIGLDGAQTMLTLQRNDRALMIGPPVGEQVGVVQMCSAEHRDTPAWACTEARTHVQRVDCQPQNISADYASPSCSQAAHCTAFDVGRLTAIGGSAPRTLTRISPVHRSGRSTQRRSRLALRSQCHFDVDSHISVAFGPPASYTENSPD